MFKTWMCVCQLLGCRATFSKMMVFDYALRAKAYQEHLCLDLVCEGFQDVFDGSTLITDSRTLRRIRIAHMRSRRCSARPQTQIRSRTQRVRHGLPA